MMKTTIVRLLRPLASLIAALLFLALIAVSPSHAQDDGDSSDNPIVIEEPETEEYVEEGCAVTGESLGVSALCAGTTYTIYKTKYVSHSTDLGCCVKIGMQVKYRANPYDSYNYVTVEYQKVWISTLQSTQAWNSPRMYDVDFGIMNSIGTSYLKQSNNWSGNSSITKWWNYGRAADVVSRIHYKLNLKWYSDPSYTWKALLNG